MERMYYTINEADAKTAKEMMSFDDYKEGSRTANTRDMLTELMYWQIRLQQLS